MDRNKNKTKILAGHTRFLFDYKTRVLRIAARHWFLDGWGLLRVHSYARRGLVDEDDILAFI